MRRASAILTIVVLLAAIIPGAAAYGNVTSFYVNITTTAGAQTDYQMRFIISNASGVSGYSAPDNIIFTNGTTRADLADIMPTDAVDVPLSFWMEPGTQTSANATVWVLVPSIAPENSTVLKWYYGDPAVSTSLSNGYKTFPAYFTDWAGSSINSSQETLAATGSCTATVSGGIVNVSHSGAGSCYLRSLNSFGYNYAYRHRAYPLSEGNWFSIGAMDRLVKNMSYVMNGGTRYYENQKDGTATDAARSDALTAYTVIEVARYSAGMNNFSLNNVLKASVSGNAPTASLNASVGVWQNGVLEDWSLVRKAAYPEPTTSIYVTKATTAPIIIYDTDLCGDADDVGSLSMLNRFTMMGTANLTAVIIDSSNTYSAPAAYAINNFYGHGLIPIGTRKSTLPGDPTASVSVYTQHLRDNFGIAGDTGSNYPNTTTVYRQALADAPNGSVIIIAEGYYGPLADLLQSPADSISTLNGSDLVRLKVSKMVSVAGVYPTNYTGEWNFAKDPVNASYVFGNWPSQISSVGIELGDTVYSAPPSYESPSISPVRAAYNMSLGNNTRQSWGPLGVLHAITNPSTHFTQGGSNGNTTIYTNNGSNAWTQTPQNRQYYLKKSATDAALVAVINASLIDPPCLNPQYTIGTNRYCFATRLTATANAATGDLAGYPIEVNLSKAYGVPSITGILTNASTRPGWEDVVVTNTSGSPLPFWPGNGTPTETTLGVNAGTITTSGTEIWIFWGNMTQVTSSGSGYATYPLFDDFLTGSLNSTMWKQYDGTVTFSEGAVCTDTGTEAYITSYATFPKNYSFRTRINTSSDTEGWSSGFGQAGGANQVAILSAGVKRWLNELSGVQSVSSRSTSVLSMTVVEMRRYETASNFSAGTESVVSSENMPTAALNVTIWNGGTGAARVCWDWVLVRPAQYPEPTTSGYGPIASNFTGAPTSGAFPHTVTFTDSSTNAPTSWLWDFGDGNTTNNTQQNPVHTFNDSGTYNIALKATGPVGSSWKNRTAYVTVTGGETAPLAMFAQDKTIVLLPRSVQFNDTSTNTPTAWNWSFGDGKYSEDQNPSHQYVKRGLWTVLLNASNAAGYSTNTSTLRVLGG